VQYERLHILFRSGHLWRQVVLSLVLNWVLGPFVRASCAMTELPA
jgi:ACR3 family arsenite transporter